MARDMLKFSPTMLGDFKRCPRCFWLARNHGVKWPRGIYPSLPSGIDAVAKTYLDTWRAKGEMPLELKSQLPEGAILFKDQALLDKWRAWQTGPQCQFKAHDGKILTLRGGLDDLLEFPDRTVAVLDVKTNGFGPKEGSTKKYYGRQASGYKSMLEGEGRTVSDLAHFAYFWPKEIKPNGVIDFNCQVKSIEIVSGATVGDAIAAHKCLSGPMPRAIPYNRKTDTGCEQCAYVMGRQQIISDIKEAAKA